MKQNHNPTRPNSNFTDRPKEVLVFDQYGRLMAMFKSVYSAGMSMFIQPQAISNCCVGTTRSSSGLYFRHLHYNVTIESVDLGKLMVQDYDKAVGEYRLYKKSSIMAREREEFLNKRK